MSAAPVLALIINTYNQPQYLSRVLAALNHQTSAPDEVFLADDGSGSETREVFTRWAEKSVTRSQHVWQEHQGFRRARILNEAIAQARSEYLVFLDGDTVPHPEFVADHRRLARDSAFIQGHRALVKQVGAAYFGSNNFRHDRRRAMWQLQLEGWKHAFRWPRPLVRTRQDLRGIRGCNLGMWRDHLIKVNGYNEAFVGWGREDSELAVRLMNSGVERLDVRGWALCFHLWHPPADRSKLQANTELLTEARKGGATRCELGLDTHSPGAAA
jgi:glycosyltransferase involved in cell wall biosynthesis